MPDFAPVGADLFERKCNDMIFSTKFVSATKEKSTTKKNEPWVVRQVTAEGIFLTEREIQIGYSNGDYVCVTGVEEGECFDMGYKAIVGG